MNQVKSLKQLSYGGLAAAVLLHASSFYLIAL